MRYFMKANRTGRGEQNLGGGVRRPSRALAPSAVAAAVAVASTLLAPAAWSKAPAAPRPAKTAPVAGVTVQAAGLGPGVSAPLRRGAEAEARHIGWKDVPGRERVVLSTSLVRLETARHAGGARTTAVVAVGVFGVDGGDVKAVIEGSAEVKGESPEARQAAVEAAARGAVRNVPAAMRLGRPNRPSSPAPPAGVRRAPPTAPARPLPPQPPGGQPLLQASGGAATAPPKA
jgi:hypothetical protein